MSVLLQVLTTRIKFLQVSYFITQVKLSAKMPAYLFCNMVYSLQ